MHSSIQKEQSAMENLRSGTRGESLPDEVVLERLKAEHQALEKRLEELNGHIYLTPEEQVEKKRIQKLKLAAKDHIQALTARLGRA
jgi:hypothetical protein